MSSLRRAARMRMSGWVLAAALLTIAVLFVAPHQLPVSLYKISLVALAAVCGYWIDRSLFPYARPDAILELADFGPPGIDTGAADDAPAPVPAADGSLAFVAEIDSAPDDALLRLMGACMLRRALLVAATMLAVGLGA